MYLKYMLISEVKGSKDKSACVRLFSYICDIGEILIMFNTQQSINVLINDSTFETVMLTAVV